jgi:hypothetical protein
MKNLVQKQKMRVAGLCLAIGMSAAVGAQNVTTDATKQAVVKIGTDRLGAIKVVDNKGTIKYLQAQNGMTMVTNTAANVTTTTWQLGGTLTADTYIDATGKVFALDGLELATGSASTDAVSGSRKGDTSTATGFTFLVRDEATGATKKLKLGDLIVSGVKKITVATGGIAAQDFDLALPAGVVLSDLSKVSVYRNGIKLLASDDYAFSGTAGSITITPKAGTGNDDEWQFIDNDVVEVHWAK